MSIIRERPKTSSIKSMKNLIGNGKDRIKSADNFTRNSQPHSFLAKSNSLLNSRLNRFDQGKDL